MAASAAAQDRDPSERQALTDLGYTLGESHALRQACHGEGDQYWRARMRQLIELEAPDQGFATRVANAFNAGYASAQAGHPSCTAKARRAAARAAARGRGLAAGLANR